MGRIIAIVNQKGGVGKTTTTINLAYCLSSQNKKILAIDIDPQANATSGLGVDKSKLDKTIYDVLINERPIQDCVIKTDFSDLDLVPSNSQLTGAEVELVSLLAREYRLKKALDSISPSYDYILIDCPPSLSLLTINAMTAADSILIPIQCEYYALEGLAQLLRTYELIKRNLNSKLDIEGAVLTMADSRTNLTSQVTDEIRKAFGAKVYKTIIPRSIKLGEAPSFGKPIVLYAPSSTGSLAYKFLSDEILGLTKNDPIVSQVEPYQTVS